MDKVPKQNKTVITKSTIPTLATCTTATHITITTANATTTTESSCASIVSQHSTANLATEKNCKGLI